LLRLLCFCCYGNCTLRLCWTDNCRLGLHQNAKLNWHLHHSRSHFMRIFIFALFFF
jgi:hypothetical protein